MIDKAEFAEEGTFFANRFPSLRTFVTKNVEIWKKIAHLVYKFETEKLEFEK